MGFMMLATLRLGMIAFHVSCELRSERRIPRTSMLTYTPSMLGCSLECISRIIGTTNVALDRPMGEGTLALACHSTIRTMVSKTIGKPNRLDVQTKAAVKALHQRIEYRRMLLLIKRKLYYKKLLTPRVINHVCYPGDHQDTEIDVDRLLALIKQSTS